MIKKIYTCKRCDKEFSRYPCKGRDEPKYCSRDCYWPKRTPEYLIKILKISYEGHVIKQKGCWDWSGSFGKDGYGQIGCSRELKISKAHRASWIIHRGEIQDGMCVLHKCDNKRCTNPDHLFLGTNLENSRDLVYKERQLRGSKNGAAKITEEIAKDIKKSLQEGVSGSYLGRKHGVSKAIISRIKCGKSWKHVEA